MLTYLRVLKWNNLGIRRKKNHQIVTGTTNGTIARLVPKPMVQTIVPLPHRPIFTSLSPWQEISCSSESQIDYQRCNLNQYLINVLDQFSPLSDAGAVLKSTKMTSSVWLSFFKMSKIMEGVISSGTGIVFWIMG